MSNVLAGAGVRDAFRKAGNRPVSRAAVHRAVLGLPLLANTLDWRSSVVMSALLDLPTCDFLEAELRAVARAEDGSPSRDRALSVIHAMGEMETEAAMREGRAPEPHGVLRVLRGGADAIADRLRRAWREDAMTGLGAALMTTVPGFSVENLVAGAPLSPRFRLEITPALRFWTGAPREPSGFPALAV